jgi:hypothetical protein
MNRSPRLSSTADIAAMLERFFDLVPGLGPNEWDDFEHERFSDPRLEAWRQRILVEIGHLVAPMAPENEVIVSERVDQIIGALKRNEDA